MNEVTKEEILAKIKSTAKINNGIPLGMKRFYQETNIDKNDWIGKYWTKWGDALKEAGFDPNKFGTTKFDEEYLLQRTVEYIKELNSFPTRAEFKIKKTNDEAFPSMATFDKYFGLRNEFLKRIIQYCVQKTGLDDVIDICEKNIKPLILQKEEDEFDKSILKPGMVYLMKSGKYFKIGKSKHTGARHSQISPKLPERLDIIHQITTDDMDGIEKYWHNRFKDKRKNGEWFALTKNDILAFKSRKGRM